VTLGQIRTLLEKWQTQEDVANLLRDSSQYINRTLNP